MPSIRLFLTLTIIAIITLVNFLSSLRGYRESMNEAEQLFEEQLMEYALLISTLLPAGDKIKTNYTADQSPDRGTAMAYQVFTEDGELLNAFNTAQTEPVVRLEAGYNDANFDNYRWHTLTYQDRSNNRWVVVAQRDDVQYTLAEQMVLESVLPTILGIPVAGLIVWFLIGAGLRPISRLARELEAKEATDLSPVDLDPIPREIAPLRESTNALLSRLQASFTRERRFAADAAHELRTPISVLKVQIHNLLSDLDSPLASAEQLNSGIDRMGHLVEQILDLNKTAPDIYMAQLKTVDLFDICQRVISSQYDQIMQKDQKIELLGQSATVTGDDFALSTMIKNLLDNASKYTPEQGHIKIEVRPEGHGVLLAVTDNGPGIPDQERERALERFYRVGGDQHKTGQSGCGLGLAIVKHIVELHKATIELGAPDKGTGLRVEVYFPAGEAS